MGLLDNFFSGQYTTDPDKNDAVRQSLLSVGLGLLNSRGNFGQALGQAGQQGLNTYQGARESQQQMAMRKLQIEQAQRQGEQQQQQMADEQRKRAFLQGLQSPQMAASGAAMAGGGGPTTGNAANMAPVDPNQQMMFEATKAGAMPLQSYLAALQKDDSVTVSKPGDIARDKKGVVRWQNPSNEGAENSALQAIAQVYGKDSVQYVQAAQDYIKKLTSHQQPTQVTVGLQAPVSAMDSSGNEVMVQPTNRPGAPSQIMTDSRDGKPFRPKRDANTPNKVGDAKEAIALLDQAGPLIDKATASLYGQGRDAVVGAFGASTEGAKAAAKLKVIQGALIAKMPKMSGPQSDRDVELYREMAGKVGDPNVPAESKKAAIEAIRKIQSRYAGIPEAASAPEGKSLQERADAILRGGR